MSEPSGEMEVGSMSPELRAARDALGSTLLIAAAYKRELQAAQDRIMELEAVVKRRGELLQGVIAELLADAGEYPPSDNHEYYAIKLAAIDAELSEPKGSG